MFDLSFQAKMKIFVSYKDRTKKCDVQWDTLSKTLAEKFGLETSRFIIEVKTADCSGSTIWMEVEEEADLSEGCLARLVESR